MYLKRIEIFGFKSFANPTSITCDRGINAILGPNGCGKSNVVDAVRWALGEQSSKNMRATKMEDLIFNGTDTKKPLNLAEVTLLLDNEDGSLPVDFPEISIKRRVHRSGENEYFLNNRQCRLKDIRELLFDTGIGRSSYSILEQGKIDKILSSKPEERRQIFEEAAGITKYKQWEQEAERKLEKNRENMKRVEAMFREVKRSHTTLQSQAEKAEVYRKLRDEIFLLEVDLQLVKVRKLLDARKQKRKELEQEEKRVVTYQEQLEKVQNSQEIEISQQKEVEGSLLDVQKRLYGITHIKESKLSQLKMMEERKNELAVQQETFSARLASLISQESEQQSSLKQLQASQRELANRVTENLAAQTHLNERYDNLQKERAQNQQEVQQCELSLDKLRLQLHKFQEKSDALTGKIVEAVNSGFGSHAETHSLNQHSLQEQKEQVGSLVEQLKDVLHQGSEKGAGLFGGRSAKRVQGLHAQALELMANLEQALENLYKSLPDFLVELLAPEGAMAEKSSLQESIFQNRQKEESLQVDLKNLRDSITQANQTTLQLAVEREELRVTGAELAGELERVELSLQQVNHRLAEITSQTAALEQERSRVAEQLESQSKQILHMDKEWESMNKEEESLKKKREKLSASLQHMDETLKKKHEQIAKRQEQFVKSSAKIERLTYELEMVVHELEELYETFEETHSRSLKEFESRTFTVQKKDLRERLQKKRAKVQSLGQINFAAPEEFQEVHERYLFLDEQLKDLEKACSDLEAVTREMRQTASERFIAQYHQIQKNFHSMFRRLFAGGRGELKLTDPDNVLESGVEMFAQPPGKVLENISLLSGGERSLTAVALLFATYMVKPSPFCILDEMDAALDEANIGRFVGVLTEFSENSQFIIITHSKKTVTGAQSLIGITMEEPGVTKLVTLKLGEDEPIDKQKRLVMK